MKKNASRYMLMACLGITTLFVPTLAHAGQTIATIDMRRCFEQSKEGIEAKEVLERLNGEVTEKLSGIENEIKEMSSQLGNEEYRSNLSEEALSEMEKKFESLLQEREARNVEFSQQFNQTQMFLSESIIENLTKGAQVVAKAKGYDLILQKEAIFYGADANDVTSDVLAQADKFYQEQSKEKPAKK